MPGCDFRTTIRSMKFPDPQMFLSIATAVLIAASSGSLAAEPADGKVLAGELFGYLGLDQTKRTELEAGEVVHNGLSRGRATSR